MDSAMLKFLKDHPACPISPIINLSICRKHFLILGRLQLYLLLLNQTTHISSHFQLLPICWFQSYLTGQHIIVTNQLSPALELYTKLEGSMFGPLMFSLYVNDLPSVYPDVETQFYEDDTDVCACPEKAIGSCETHFSVRADLYIAKLFLPSP